jgi:Fe-S oxidoreductase
MFSEMARKNSDACRFCWMCRHLCPLGLTVGKETNSPRAKGLMVSLVERGYAYTEEMAADMYECCLCEACTNDCATGFVPPSYIREARTRAVVEGIAPKAVIAAIDGLMEKGNLYGREVGAWKAGFLGEIAGLPARAPVALHIGATVAYRRPEIAVAAIRLLRKAGVEFCLIADELQTGAELGDLEGFVDEVRQVARAASAQIDATGAATVVVLDPSAARMLIRECGEWACGPAARVVTATSYFADLVRSGALTPSKLEMRPVTYHDPCRLARDLDETKPARELIAAMGLQLNEMFLRERMTKCCGGVILDSHSPRLADMTARGRWEDAKRTGASTLVTACAGCLDILGKVTPGEMDIDDILVLLARSCGV